jgi:hypothetical protein
MMGLPKNAFTDGFPDSKSLNSRGTGMRLAKPSSQQIAVAMETLTNLFYLLEHHAESPDHVRTFASMAEEPLRILRKSFTPLEPATPSDT